MRPEPFRERDALLTNNYAEPMEIQALTLEVQTPARFSSRSTGDPRVVGGQRRIIRLYRAPSARGGPHMPPRLAYSTGSRQIAAPG